ncbi:MAG: riboflavin synthase [Candidatus Hydrogenedentes bacterium]|nr:riboflavin synthase [Candidatus Hydrogenedentota bacterium]
MFTGIIEEVGAVSRVSGPDLAIMAERVLEGMAGGDSIAIDGACMTVVEFTGDTFVVQVSPESMKRTTLGALKPGDAVNLERAMAAGERFGGHFVQGHVDGVGRVESVRRLDEFALWRFNAPPEVARYIVPKGSVTIDGISLTVVDPAAGSFDVAIIPETLKKTKLQSKQAGDPVNMEADMLAKHIFHYMKGAETDAMAKEFLLRRGSA